MELNNLLTNLKKKPSDSPKFLALEINSDSVKSAVWEVVGTKPQIVSIGTVETLNSTTKEDILEAVDASISKAVEPIDPEPNQIVFSIPDNWVNQSEIDKDKKDILKHLSQKLDLKPLGFVITLESIIHYLHQKKGHPPTAVLVGVSSEEISLTIIENGTTKGTQQVGRSEDLGADLEEGIARFGSISNLPSNLILYDGATDLDSLKQDLIGYNLQDRLPFLHIPKITSLSPAETIEAVVIAGGAEVITSLQVPSTSPSSTHPDSELQSASNLGFSVSHPPEIDTTDTTLDTNLDNLEPVSESLFTPSASEPSSDNSPPSKSSSVFKSAVNFFKFPRLYFSFGLPTLFIIGLILIAIIPVGAGVAYWYLPTATVDIYFEPKITDKNLSFILDPTITSPDFSSNTLPGNPVETEVTSELSAPATGEKLVGEKASGQTTLYNRTDSVKTFASGTRLTTATGLIYTIDQTVQLASASTKENLDLSITKQPATAEVAITAIDIGAQYNISQDTELLVANFDKSSFVAKTKTPISGGTSRQITAVSQEDITNLRNQVTAELERKATQEIATTPQNLISAIILPDQEDNLSEIFSAKEGDEANQITLTSSMKVNTMSYKLSDLQQLIRQTIGGELPPNYQLSDQPVDITPQQVKIEDSGQVSITASVPIKLIPDFKPEEIASRLTGHYPATTESYFKGLPGFSRVEIDIKPSLPPKLKTFPRVKSRITVNLHTQN